MSVEPTRTAQTDVCDYEPCDDTYEIHGGQHVGGFCSEICFHRDLGANILDRIRHDQRLCATCFRPVRSIDKPSRDWLENAASFTTAAIDAGATFQSIGSQLALDITDVNGGSRPIDADAIMGEQYPTEHTVVGPGGWGCKCGNIDHRHRDDAIEHAERDRVVVHLYYALQRLADEGAIDQSPSWREMRAALEERWRDWEYAIGRSLRR